jgi:DNA-binding protein H-NS
MNVFIIFIPVNNPGQAQEDLNDFLLSHSVVDRREEFVTSPELGFVYRILYHESRIPNSKTTAKSFAEKVKESADAAAATNKKRKSKDWYEHFEEPKRTTYVTVRDCRNALARKDGLTDPRTFSVIFSNDELASLVENSAEITQEAIESFPLIDEAKRKRSAKRLADTYSRVRGGMTADEAAALDDTPVVENKTSAAAATTAAAAKSAAAAKPAPAPDSNGALDLK